MLEDDSLDFRTVSGYAGCLEGRLPLERERAEVEHLQAGSEGDDPVLNLAPNRMQSIMG